MKYLILATIILGSLGCSSKTVHEQCSDPEVAVKYRDYNQCYAEISAAHERKRQAWRNMGQSIQQSTRQPSGTTNCSTIGSQTTCQSY